MRRIRTVLAAFACLAALGVPRVAQAEVKGTVGAQLAACASSIASQEMSRGKLTVATDATVQAPWFVNNKPSNAQGFEAALVYAIAKALRVKRSNVVWVNEPFDASFSPGPKAFDFDANEVAYSRARVRAVSFSSSYFDVSESIVALRQNPIVAQHSSAQLRTYQYGDQIGTPGLAYIQHYIKPARPVMVYATLDQVVTALQRGQINALVIDTPTGQYMASAQIVDAANRPLATVVAQFPSIGDHYGLVFRKDNPLVGCVNTALAALRTNGTLAHLARRWLGIYTKVPVIEP